MNTPSQVQPETPQDFRMRRMKTATLKAFETIDAAGLKEGVTRTPTTIALDIRARAGEYMQMNDAAQRNSTRELLFVAKNSGFDEITTNDKGERIMPKSMLEGLAKRIENAFNEEARLYDSPHAQGNGVLQFTLREGDLKCNYIEDDEPMDLSTALSLLVQVLNKERTNKITVVFQDGEKTLLTQGEITE